MQTVRQQMTALLSQQVCSARDLSQTLHIQEKEVYDHLSHISRSLVSRRQKLVIIPSECLQCGYVFKERKRLTRPSRCPRCRGERIEEPKYQVV
jgi:predicted Zn-ribbon and HTH transcriptional regulator